MKFRNYHLNQIMERFEDQRLPLDVFLGRYFRAHTAIGSKDRKFLSETIYENIRWKGLFQYLNSALLNPSDFLHREDIPIHIRLSFPELYYQAIRTAYGNEKAWEICLISNSRAPTAVRANLLKTSRDALLDRWRPLYKVAACKHSLSGILFSEKINFFALPEFKEGFFEIQDEASQLIACLVAAEPKSQVLDYCAGAGGKTLAFAPGMRNTGQIYLHDIRSFALQEARKRLNRAGVQNVQFGIHPSMKKKMDWVLVDAPCSGSGTLRRNPDMKWRFNFENFPHLIREQREIFTEALEYVKPGGKIVYATCSIFPQENQEQAVYFQERFQLKALDQFQSLPEAGGMDGFFGIVLQKL